MYRVFGQLADPPDETGLVGGVVDSLWARLRIPVDEIKRRMKVAARISRAANSPDPRCHRNCRWWLPQSSPAISARTTCG